MTTIAYVDTARDLGGAERSLIELLAHLDLALFQPVLLHARGAVWLGDPLLPAIGLHEVFPPLGVLERRRDEVAGRLVARLQDISQALRLALGVKRRLVRCGAELVHTNTLKAHLIGGLAARLAGLPLVWHVRDILPPGAARRLLHQAARRCHPHIIAISRAVAAQFAGWPVQCHVIPNGIPLDRFTPGPPSRQLRVRLGLRDGVPVICNVARLTPWKGHRTLLEALARLRAEGPAFQALIVGEVAFWDDNYEQELHRLAGDLGLDDVVVWTGFRADVAQLLRLSDIFVLPSENEPFGRAIVEAMAVGLPVVACRSGGVPEIVVHEQTGLLVDPGDPEQLAGALSRLLADPQEARLMKLDH